MANPFTQTRLLGTSFPTSFPLLSFTPDKLGSALALWLNANPNSPGAAGNVSFAGSVATAITSEAPASGIVLSQATPAQQMVYTASAQNGLPGVSNTNSSTTTPSYLSVGAQVPALNFDYNTPFSICGTGIFNTTSAQGARFLGQCILTGGLTQGWLITRVSGKLSFWFMNNGLTNAWVLSTSIALTNGQPFSYMFLYDGSGTTAGFSIYINGVPDSSPTKTVYGTGVSSSSSAKTTGTTPLAMWGNVSSGLNYDTLLENFIATTRLTADQITGAESYLNGIWAVHS